MLKCSSRGRVLAAVAGMVAALVSSASAQFTVEQGSGWAGVTSDPSSPATPFPPNHHSYQTFADGTSLMVTDSYSDDVDVPVDLGTVSTSGVAKNWISGLGTASYTRGTLYAFADASHAAELEPGIEDLTFGTSSEADVYVDGSVTMSVLATTKLRGYWIYNGISGQGKVATTVSDAMFWVSVRAGANLSGDLTQIAGDVLLRYEVWDNTPTPASVFDVNGSGAVNQFDLSLIAYNIGGTYDAAYDVDGIYGVTSADVDAVLASLGTVRGDIDLNGMVNFNDLIMFAQHYNSVGSWFEGDFNGDGLVNFTDNLALAQNYGYGSLQGGSYTADAAFLRESTGLVVPEPAAVSLILAGIASGLRRRR